ncbi:putative cysteine-rich receptor-like protein kinase 35 [Vitis vinifera]|uniref:non-specific serine/threonine protein kinase n=1 Tax=Vitis vinifera TaxID=29760 RepID=A0A438E7L6_VITVI|nr:putative cysteine-rich receptor-like protein kinase 35 [Vitis vinifera]
MISQPSHRKSFIESSIKTARLYGFQGLDLSGYWPRTVSNTINMGILFDEWRAAVNSESRDPSESPLILTLKVHCLPTLGSVSYEVDSIRRNLDWVHVAAYDYYLPSSVNFTHAHAALYDPVSRVNTDFCIGEWIGRGLPAGSWFWVWRTMVNYCSFGATWIGYDDVEAIRTKVSYAKEKGLLGYFVWEVSHDENWVLSLAEVGGEGLKDLNPALCHHATCVTQRPTFAAQDEDQDEGNKQRLLVIILLPIAIVVLLTTLKSLPIKLGSNISSANSDDPNLQVFSFTTIKVATNNFSSENKLGEGGFGPVYKGKLPKGQEIAVKRLSKTSHQGLEEFKNEVTLTATLQHVNLVKLLGFCTQREEKMLIYECMPNRSLDFYLFGRCYKKELPSGHHALRIRDLKRMANQLPFIILSSSNQSPLCDPEGQVLLDWGKRIHIIEGITQGLLYLQEYSRLRIIHRDLKASNILLDGEMKPKIADFGIARIFQKDENEANTGRIVGTYGYVSPEYVQKGTYSVKSDAYELWKDGKSMEFMDPSLDDACSSCKLTRCMQVALLCVQENPADRPSMLEVDSKIKNETAAIATPRRPAFAAKRDEVEADGKSVSCHEIGSVNVTTISQVLPR